MAITLTSTGIQFSDGGTQASTPASANDHGSLLSISSYTQAGTYTWSSKVPAITPATVTWNYSGSGVSASGSSPYTLTHSAAPATWTQSAYSTQSGSLVCAQASPAQTSNYIMFGLTSSPGASYTNINYALYYSADGVLYVYEGGNNVGAFGAYNTNFVGRVTYDGSYIRYYADAYNGLRPIRVVAVSGLTLQFEAAFYNGGSLNGVYFGALTNTQTNTVVAKLVGGGGGSAGYSESGASGGYSEGRLVTTGIESVTVTVGGGGAGIAYYAAASGGGTSSFGSYFTATGGGGSNTYTSHSSGHGGSASGGQVNLGGGAGTGHCNSTGAGAISRGGGSYFGGSAAFIRYYNPTSSGGSTIAFPGAPGCGAPGANTDGYGGSTGAAGESGAVVVYAYK